jgi:hypothetical protein
MQSPKKGCAVREGAHTVAREAENFVESLTFVLTWHRKF